MIVGVCSYPRSGNTFLRVVLKHLYGVRTSVVYDVDGVAERVGRELVGYTDRAASVEAMRASARTTAPRCACWGTARRGRAAPRP